MGYWERSALVVWRTVTDVLKRRPEALRLADAKVGKEFRAKADYAAGIDEVLKWDGNLAHDSKGALKFTYWREVLAKVT